MGLQVMAIPEASAGYLFTSHTFTNCSTTGRTGPSQASCRSAYSTTWDDTDANFTVASGIQIWTVPASGLYRINAYGAAGSGGNGGTSSGGSGARVQGDFTLTEGDKIRILVGQMGAHTGYQAGDGASGAGGGGTFVVSGTTGSLDTQVLVIAAGGGGSNDPIYQGSVSNGLGGSSASTGTGDGENSGGSYRGSSNGASLNGASFQNGGQGGYYSRGASAGTGGFGGGGATDDSRTGGGGWVGGTASTPAYSKNNGTNTVATDAANSGHGYVQISSLGPGINTFLPRATLTKTNPTYDLEFSTTVTGLATSDFSLSGTGSSTCSVASVTGSNSTYVVTLSGCSSGTVILTLTANSVQNSSAQNGPGSNTSASTVTVDLVAPTITSISAPTNGTYLPGNTLTFTATTSETVTVIGSPRIQLTLGVTNRYASYASGSNSRTLTFTYLVPSDINDLDLDGIAIASPLQLNSGSISDLASNAMSDLSFTPPTTTNVLISQAAAAPTIDSIDSGNTTVTVNFTAGASNGSTITNYKYSINNGSSFVALSPTDSSPPITISGLTNSTSYQILIKAVTAAGDGAASNMLSATPSAFATVAISLTASATTATKGTAITITANVSQAGKVTFYWNNKRISGCINKTAVTSATCTWKPAVRGQWSISAALKPTNLSYSLSNSTPLQVLILNRTGPR